MNWCVCGILGCLALGTTHSAAQVHPATVVTGHYVKPNCPEWLHTAGFYQLYPQTFYDSDGDGIGDLKGLIQELGYVKSLGVDGIWINPFFQSPFHDAGYQTALLEQAEFCFHRPDRHSEIGWCEVHFWGQRQIRHGISTGHECPAALAS